MWKHKNKERNSFELKLEKILTWKYSDQFWYFGHIFLLRYLIDLILAATERGLEDLKLCSLQKLQNLQYSRPKPTWKLTYCWKTEIDFFYFSFLEACVFRVLNVIYIKGVQGQPRFLLLGNLIFHNFFIVFIFFGSLRT